MPEFVYRASDASGAVTEGKIDAATSSLALRQLQTTS